MTAAQFYTVDGHQVFGVPAGDVVLDDQVPAVEPASGYYFARAWR